MVPETQAIALAEALDEVVEYAQDTYGRIKEDAELHAYDLAWGRADWHHFKGNPSASADVYKRAIDAIARFDVTISCRGVDLAGLRARYDDRADKQSVVLTFAFERIQIKAKQLDTVALVVADEVGAKQAIYRQNFSFYQKYGTWGWKPQTLDRLIDTIHFTPSHSSRLLQAADLVSYTRFEKYRTDGHPRAREFYLQQWDTLLPRVMEDSTWVP